MNKRFKDLKALLTTESLKLRDNCVCDVKSGQRYGLGEFKEDFVACRKASKDKKDAAIKAFCAKAFIDVYVDEDGNRFPYIAPGEDI